MRPAALTFVLLGFALASAGAPATADAQVRRPVLNAPRCLPAAAPACASGVQVAIGRRLQLRGRGLYRRMRVSFSWSRGSITARMARTRAGFLVRVPPGTKAGTVSVRARNRRGLRSNARRVRVLAPPRTQAPPAASPAPGQLPAAFQGNGMWIWQLGSTEGGNVQAIIARARAAGMSAVFIKSSDGGANRWTQFNPGLVSTLKAAGLKVCAWQFVYGADPVGEARLGADAVADGADCLVIDAETRYEGRYAAAQHYLSTLRAAIGPDYPVGLTTFPYVDLHQSFPYSVFLGPGGAQANLPQVYWRAIGDTVDASSARTYAQNRLYGTPIAPLGQTWQDPPASELRRFRQLWAAYGSTGLSWWSWQETSVAEWRLLGGTLPAIPAPADPGWPALGSGSRGDQVFWVQQHLLSLVGDLTVSGRMDAPTVAALRSLQASRGLPATGRTDPATWQAVLSLPLVPVDWTP